MRAKKLVHPWGTRERACAWNIYARARFFFCLSGKQQAWPLSQKAHLWRERGYWRPPLRRPSLTVGRPSCRMSCSAAGPSQSGQRWPGWAISSSRWGKSLPCSVCFPQTHLPQCLCSSRQKEKTGSLKDKRSSLTAKSSTLPPPTGCSQGNTALRDSKKTRSGRSSTAHNKVYIAGTYGNWTWLETMSTEDVYLIARNTKLTKLMIS